MTKIDETIKKCENKGLHQRLSYYFRSTLFQPVFNCRLYTVSESVNKFLQLHINLEISR